MTIPPNHRSHHLVAVLWIATTFNTCFAQSEAKETPSSRIDHHGYALPKGASGRLGSVALRSGTGRLIAFHPDGKKLAAVRGDNIQLWDLDSGRATAQFTLDKSQQSLSVLRMVKLDVSPDGKFLAAVSAVDTSRSSDEEFQLPNYQCNIWKISTGSQVAFLERTSALFCFCGPDCFARVDDGKVKLFRISDGTIVREFPASPKDSAIRSMTYLPSRNEIVTGHVKGKLIFRAAETGRQTQVIDASQSTIHTVSGSADGKFVVADHAETCSVWDVNSRKKLGAFKKSGYFQVGTLSPDGTTLIADAVHDIVSGKALFKLNTPGRTTPEFRFTPDGKRIAAHVGAAVVFWDARTGKRVDQTDGHEGAVTQIGFSPNGMQIASASVDRTVRIWDVNKAKEISRFDGTHTFAWSPDGRLFAHASERTTWLRDSRTGKVVHLLKKDIDILGCTLTAVSFSANGKQLITAAVCEVRWWDVATGESRGQIYADLVHTWAALFRDENHVGLAGSHIDIEGNVMKLWNIKEKRVVRKFGDGKASLTACVLTPNERHLLVSTEKEIHLYDVVTGNLTKPFGDGVANCMAIDSRGTTVAFCRDDRVQIWDLAAKVRLMKFETKQREVFSINFSPDGRTLVTGGIDSTIVLWRVAGLLEGEAGAQDTASLWQALGDEDVRKQYRAKHLLAARPIETITLLSKVLHPTTPITEGKIKSLVKNLDDANHQAREKATRALVEFRDGARFELERMAGSSSLETKRRIAMIIAHFDTPTKSERQQYHGIAVLELIGDEDACSVLEKLSRGAAGARSTTESQVALKRLRSRVLE